MESIVYQFSAGQLSVSVGLLIVAIGVVQFLLSNWIKNRLEKSIQHEYDKKLEEYKFLQTQRQKAEIIAKFFANWIKFRGKERTYLQGIDLLNYYESLNQMSFEVALWVADDKILEDVMKRFQNADDAKDIRALMGEFRKLILGIQKSSFDIQQITIWPTDEIAKEIGLIEQDKNKTL